MTLLIWFRSRDSIVKRSLWTRLNIGRKEILLCLAEVHLLVANTKATNKTLRSLAKFRSRQQVQTTSWCQVTTLIPNWTRFWIKLLKTTMMNSELLMRALESPVCLNLGIYSMKQSKNTTDVASLWESFLARDQNSMKSTSQVSLEPGCLIESCTKFCFPMRFVHTTRICDN